MVLQTELSVMDTAHQAQFQRLLASRGIQRQLLPQFKFLESSYNDVMSRNKRPEANDNSDGLETLCHPVVDEMISVLLSQDSKGPTKVELQEFFDSVKNVAYKAMHRNPDISLNAYPELLHRLDKKYCCRDFFESRDTNLRRKKVKHRSSACDYSRSGSGSSDDEKDEAYPDRPVPELSGYSPTAAQDMDVLRTVSHILLTSAVGLVPPSTGQESISTETPFRGQIRASREREVAIEGVPSLATGTTHGLREPLTELPGRTHISTPTRVRPLRRMAGLSPLSTEGPEENDPSSAEDPETTTPDRNDFVRPHYSLASIMERSTFSGPPPVASRAVSQVNEAFASIFGQSYPYESESGLEPDSDSSLGSEFGYHDLEEESMVSARDEYMDQDYQLDKRFRTSITLRLTRSAFVKPEPQIQPYFPDLDFLFSYKQDRRSERTDPGADSHSTNAVSSWDVGYKTPKPKPYSQSDFIQDAGDFLLTNTPVAETYPNHIKLKHLGSSHLLTSDPSCPPDPYKMNKTAATDPSSGFNWFIMASETLIHIHEYGQDDVIAREPVFKFSVKRLAVATTQPGLTINHTTDLDRQGATRPFDPHTVNYLKLGRWRGKDSLVVAKDDGKVLLWYLETINREMFTPSNRDGVVVPDFLIISKASVWGVDLYDEENLIVVSDNSRRVSLFLFEPCQLDTGNFYFVRSEPLTSNVPYVSFVKSKARSNKVYVTCCTIAGEVIIMEFAYKKTAVEKKPILAEYMNFISLRDPSLCVAKRGGVLVRRSEVQAPQVLFQDPFIVSRATESSMCWSANVFQCSWFLSVASLWEVNGDWSADETALLATIDAENEILGDDCNPCVTSDLGLAGRLCPTQTISLWGNKVCEELSDSKLTENVRRSRKVFDDFYLAKRQQTSEYPVLKDMFIVVTTEEGVSLRNGDNLYTTATSGATPVFPRSVFASVLRRIEGTNRISLVEIVPELSCVVIATQTGLVSIFRLTDFRGIKGMRPEHLFPNTEKLCKRENGYRSIVGLTVKKINHLRFVLYVTYTDYFVLAYELKGSALGEVEAGLVY